MTNRHRSDVWRSIYRDIRRTSRNFTTNLPERGVGMTLEDIFNDIVGDLKREYEIECVGTKLRHVIEIAKDSGVDINYLMDDFKKLYPNHYRHKEERKRNDKR